MEWNKKKNGIWYFDDGAIEGKKIGPRSKCLCTIYGVAECWHVEIQATEFSKLY